LASNKDFIAGSYSITGYNRLSLGRGALLQPGQGYATSYKEKTTLISFFGRATVNLSDKYNVTARCVRMEALNSARITNGVHSHPLQPGG